MQPQTRTDAMPQWPLPLKNETGDVIPGFGVAEVDADGGLGTAILYTASAAPTTGSALRCLIVGPLPIADDTQGKGTGDFPAVALYEPDDGDDPVAGDEWGPDGDFGDYALHRTGTGFIIIGGADSDAKTVHVNRAGGTGGGGTSAPSGNIILIDFDFKQVDEADPAKLLEEADIAGEPVTGTATAGDTDSITLEVGASTVDSFYDEYTITITGGTGSGQTRTIGDYDGETLTATVDEDWDTPPDNTSEYEITPGFTVIFQDPPNDDFDTNVVDNLNLWGSKVPNVLVKYYKFDTDPLTGTGTEDTSNTIILEDGASTVDGFYIGWTITVDGQTQVVIGYVGGTRVVTVADNWSPSLTDFGYSMVSDANIKLVTTIVDVPDHDPPLKVVRYSTRKVWYIDGEAKDFERESYTRSDYPDYPEDEFFPPDGDGTFQEMPDGFFKKRYRACTNYRLGKEWIDFQTCIELPAPPLIPVSDE